MFSCSNNPSNLLKFSAVSPLLHRISVSLGNSTKIQHSPPSLNTTDRLIKYNCLSSRTTDLHLPLPMYRNTVFLRFRLNLVFKIQQLFSRINCLGKNVLDLFSLPPPTSLFIRSYNEAGLLWNRNFKNCSHGYIHRMMAAQSKKDINKG